jgi:hypothetical protein
MDVIIRRGPQRGSQLRMWGKVEFTGSEVDDIQSPGAKHMSLIAHAGCLGTGHLAGSLRKMNSRCTGQDIITLLAPRFILALYHGALAYRVDASALKSEQIPSAKERGRDGIHVTIRYLLSQPPSSSHCAGFTLRRTSSRKPQRDGTRCYPSSRSSRLPSAGTVRTRYARYFPFCCAPALCPGSPRKSERPLAASALVYLLAMSMSRDS